MRRSVTPATINTIFVNFGNDSTTSRALVSVNGVPMQLSLGAEDTYCVGVGVVDGGGYDMELFLGEPYFKPAPGVIGDVAAKTIAGRPFSEYKVIDISKIDDWDELTSLDVPVLVFFGLEDNDHQIAALVFPDKVLRPLLSFIDGVPNYVVDPVVFTYFGVGQADGGSLSRFYAGAPSMAAFDLDGSFLSPDIFTPVAGSPAVNYEGAVRGVWGDPIVVSLVGDERAEFSCWEMVLYSGLRLW